MKRNMHEWLMHEDLLVANYAKKGLTDMAAKVWLASLLKLPLGKVSARMADFTMLYSGMYPHRHYSKQELFVKSIL